MPPSREPHKNQDITDGKHDKREDHAIIEGKTNRTTITAIAAAITSTTTTSTTTTSGDGTANIINENADADANGADEDDDDDDDVTTSLSTSKSVTQPPNQLRKKDPRIEWLAARVVLLLQVSNEHFDRMMHEDKHSRSAIDQFLLGAQDILVITRPHVNTLKATSTYTTSVQGVYFVVTVGNYMKSIIDSSNIISMAPTTRPESRSNRQSLARLASVGSSLVGLPPSMECVEYKQLSEGGILQQLQQLCDLVYMPLIANPENQLSWPESLSTELMRNFQALDSEISVVAGRSQRRTILALPKYGPSNCGRSPSLPRRSPSPCNRSSGNDIAGFHILESAVVAWSHSIKDVLLSSAAMQEPKDPLELLEYWSNRCDNLTFIVDQLYSESVQVIIKLLNRANSSYVMAFERMKSDVEKTLSEARSIFKMLKALRPHLLEFSNGELLGMTDLFLPFARCLKLAWLHEPLFGTSDHVYSFIGSICACIIVHACEYLGGSQVLIGEPDDCRDRLETVNEIAAALQCSIEAEISTDNSNEFTSIKNELSLAFKNLNLFRKRTAQLSHAATAAIEFGKLGCVEVGGSKGAAFTAQVQEIANLLKDVYIRLQMTGAAVNSRSGGLLDMSLEGCQAFDKTFESFCKRHEYLEHAFASLILEALDCCSDFGHMVDLLDGFHLVLEKTFVLEALRKKHSTFKALLHAELTHLRDEFTSESVSPRCYRNIPPVTGRLLWLRGLRQRCMSWLSALHSWGHILVGELGITEFINEGELLKAAIARSENTEGLGLATLITIFSSEVHMSRPLLKRLDINGDVVKIAVNMGSEIEAVLSEIRCCYSFGIDVALPTDGSGGLLVTRVAEIAKLVEQLSLVVTFYNDAQVMQSIEEIALLQPHWRLIDDIIAPALTTYTWESSDIGIYLSELVDRSRRLKGLVELTNLRLNNALRALSSWPTPLFIRDPRNNDYMRVDIVHHQRRIDTFKKALQTNCSAISTAVEDNRIAFEADSASAIWENYLRLVDRRLLDALIHHAKESIEYLLTQTNSEEFNNPSIFISVRIDIDLPKIGKKQCHLWGTDFLEESNMDVGNSINDIAHKSDIDDVDILENKEEQHDAFHPGKITCDPSIDINDSNSIHNVFSSLIDELLRASSSLSSYSGSLYFYGEMKTNASLLRLQSIFYERIAATSYSSLSCIKVLDSFSFLWLYTPYYFLNAFLRKDTRESMDDVSKLQGNNARTSDMSSPRMAVATRIYSDIFSLPDDIDDATDIKESFASVADPPSLVQYKSKLELFDQLLDEARSIPSFFDYDGWLRIDIRSAISRISVMVESWKRVFIAQMITGVRERLDIIYSFMNRCERVLTGIIQHKEQDSKELAEIMLCLREARLLSEKISMDLQTISDTVVYLASITVDVDEDMRVLIDRLPLEWAKNVRLVEQSRNLVGTVVDDRMEWLRERRQIFNQRLKDFRNSFLSKAPTVYSMTSSDALFTIRRLGSKIEKLEKENRILLDEEATFELEPIVLPFLKQCQMEIAILSSLWSLVDEVRTRTIEWSAMMWDVVDTSSLKAEVKVIEDRLRCLGTEARSWDVFEGIERALHESYKCFHIIGEFKHSAIKKRHWRQLIELTSVQLDIDSGFTLGNFLEMCLHEHENDTAIIVDRAMKEQSMKQILGDIETTWASMVFSYETHERTGTRILKHVQDLVDVLEDHQVTLQNISASKHVGHMISKITHWIKMLGLIDVVIVSWIDVQHAWAHLEAIFRTNEDIRLQLPLDAARFDDIDVVFRGLMERITREVNVVRVCSEQDLYETLERLQTQLVHCEKALADYLETKRLVYPRFYFISGADLLDILARGREAHLVSVHLPKLFDCIVSLEFEKDPQGNSMPFALGMYSKDGEYVPFGERCHCTGAVEEWLGNVVKSMKSGLYVLLKESLGSYSDNIRDQWIFRFCAQVVLITTQIVWSSEVEGALSQIELGYENTLKEYGKKHLRQLNKLISLIRGDLSSGHRQKIMTICTLEVHARDIISRLISQRVDNVAAFAWQSQLRMKWIQEPNKNGEIAEAVGKCTVEICDASFDYNYEYLGNVPRLVVTPLTDRCYITLSQSLRLAMGGAPVGPAGTGKTETVKDLGRALGMHVYVFNCSEQMDYRSVGSIFKGLSQSGAWGCFDEFNRIATEVLSVIATQIKSILDAIRTGKHRFNFQGDDIRLVKSVGTFITMNPGYRGRVEIPENIKTLFRPCSMVVPDMELICEIMLVSEGFTDTTVLARKFIMLFNLCRQLLSKQDHYDWGLRAVKSVLVVAGSLKRADLSIPEEHVLMRALRDCNLPKVVASDIEIFRGLVKDLFPRIEIERKRELSWEYMIQEAVNSKGLHTEPSFILKVVQLFELLQVRHSVFILGAPGCGKSQCWQSLIAAYIRSGQRPTVYDLNPKAVSTDELFGTVNPVTREWHDGIFCSLMRTLATTPSEWPQWIVLDGDIDPAWIESLNTAMDDCKVLTLASNERITVTPSMKFIFEAGDLHHANPSTVSRAGILYMSSTDVGWNAYLKSWLDALDQSTYFNYLSNMCEKYIGRCIEVAGMTTGESRFEQVVPVCNVALVQSFCFILEGLLNRPEYTPTHDYDTALEMLVAFSCVWAFGGCVHNDRSDDRRIAFSRWWHEEWNSSIRFPVHDTVFDYVPDINLLIFVPWTSRIPPYVHEPNIGMERILVETSETVRLKFLIDLLVRNDRPVMLVGSAGTGKSVILNRVLYELPEEEYQVVHTAFNHFTSSSMLQTILETPLEKKAGRNYGPPGTGKIVYFIDDFNMPEKDTYGTQQPHTLLRQHLDYGHWYNRSKLSITRISGVQYVGSMNPGAGSFTINPRLLRHFVVIAAAFPHPDALHDIYSSILTQHGKASRMSYEMCTFSSTELVKASLVLHHSMTEKFLPSAAKFHYHFNLRHIGRVFQGILAGWRPRSNVKTKVDLARLWLHETHRVYRDSMATIEDINMFDIEIKRICNTEFEGINSKLLHRTPLIYFYKGHYNEMLPANLNTIGDGIENTTSFDGYAEIDSFSSLHTLLNESLVRYNETHSTMDLVLFDAAMEHVVRLRRILGIPHGHALIVGVGGSGKQSLSHLAAFLGGFQVFQLAARRAYSIDELNVDLAALCRVAGIKGVGCMLLLTDAQVTDERFLVPINDIMSSGEASGLFTEEEKKELRSMLAPAIRERGEAVTSMSCWKEFERNIRDNVHVVLAFSPVGDLLRVRCRRFPALSNCSQVDFFHEWPLDALVSVAERFLSDMPQIHGEFPVIEGENDYNIIEDEIPTTQRKKNDKKNTVAASKSISNVHMNCTMTETLKYLRIWQRDKQQIGSTKILPSCVATMAFVHRSVELISTECRIKQGRYNYATPKTYLELISLYRKMLNSRTERLHSALSRFEGGLSRMQSTTENVKILKITLADQEMELVTKNATSDELLSRVVADTERVQVEREEADIEEKRVADINKEVDEQQRICQMELEKAEPALVAAQDALNTLNKPNLTELKSFFNPAPAIVMVMEAVMILFTPSTSVNKIRHIREWKEAKLFMGSTDRFLDLLVNFDKDNIHPNIIAAVRPILENEEFSGEHIRSKSIAAAGLCEWVRNITMYHDIFLNVAPKRTALLEANAKLAAARTKLVAIGERVSNLDDTLQALKSDFEEATAESNRVRDEAAKTVDTIDLANRLVNGLASENIRWAEAAEQIRHQITTIVGDVIISTSFLSYAGFFDRVYRKCLLEDNWIPYLRTESKIPLGSCLDPLEMLANSQTVVMWNNEGLPDDHFSLQNAVLITNCQRWPLIVDPQLQCIQWLKRHEEANELSVVQMGQKNYLDVIGRAMHFGKPVLIENSPEYFDPALGPLIGRITVRKGCSVMLGDHEVELDKDFRLYLHTQLSNPHFPPEIQAQVTLINCAVTPSGLEEQLLSTVVSHERPDLETKRNFLTKQQNEFKIRLIDLEDALLLLIASAEGDVLGDTSLVENLELTKRTVSEIESKVKEGSETERNINESRERYRPVAERASVLYFLMESMQLINSVYQFSLSSFTHVFQRALDAPRSSNVNTSSGKKVNIKTCVTELLHSITYTVDRYTTRMLFVEDKLLFRTQMCFQILLASGDPDISEEEVSFIIHPRVISTMKSPLDWLSDETWYKLSALSTLRGFLTLTADMKQSQMRWLSWYLTDYPELEALPHEWKHISRFRKLCILRILRPDRVHVALTELIRDKLGPHFADFPSIPLNETFKETSTVTPLFFILSPGVDPIKQVEILGENLGFTLDNGKFRDVSLGQRQEPIAERHVQEAALAGHWVLLQNIHLVPRWHVQLERLFAEVSATAHPDFRLLLTAEPPTDDPNAVFTLPRYLLQTSVKVTNEPPRGVGANILRAYQHLKFDTLESCSRDTDFRAILFGLCTFHAIVLERRHFGPCGWNNTYPFSAGDLSISVDVLKNYLEANVELPWMELRYIIGEIMYGGHISDDWDRRLCSTCLRDILSPKLLDPDAEVVPGIRVPPTGDVEVYRSHIVEHLPVESSSLFGLHSNAEFSVLTNRANDLFDAIHRAHSFGGAAGSSSGMSADEALLRECIDEIISHLPGIPSVSHTEGRAVDRSPTGSIIIQECHRATILLNEILRSLHELQLGINGELVISDAMDELARDLLTDVVPRSWEVLAYPSTAAVGSWIADLYDRVKQLERWTMTSNLRMTGTIWLAGFFSPQSFLTSIMQTAARRNQWALDRVSLCCDVLKTERLEKNVSREGTFVYGVYLEGARWDTKAHSLRSALQKENTSELPILSLRAVPSTINGGSGYMCPMYRTRQRGQTFIWAFSLPTKETADKWVLAGVCMILQT